MPALRRYPPDVMDSAVRMVLEVRRQDPQRTGVVGAVGELMNIHPEVLRHWVKKAESGTESAAETTATVLVAGEERVQSLERELADLRRVNAVLKAAALLFASELESSQPG